MDHPSTVKNSGCFAREFNFKHQTSSPHFHQSNGFIEAMVKKVKAAYKKMDGSPNAQARALLQLYKTHHSQLTYHHLQRYYTDGPHKELSCPDITDPSTYQEYADIYLKSKIHKKNTSIELTE